MIIEAITLISTANAAIGAVREFVGNGRDLMDCGKELGQYFDAKSQLQKQANPSGSGSDLEAFFALEKLKQQEAELKEMMIYSGRGGLWDDWLQFQAEAKRKRDAEANEARRLVLARRRKLREVVTIIAVALSVLCGIGIIIGIFWVLAQHGGKR
jgi:hypothetical protein